MAALEHGNSDRTKFENGDGGSLDPTYPEKTRAFEEWLLRHGARFPKLTLHKYDDEVRGVHATAAIGPDETIVEVPLECLITVEMGKDTEVGRAVLMADLEMDAPKHVYLMLFMLTDRTNPRSKFKAYYDILPPTLSNMPIFWDAEELSLLTGSYLLEQVAERNAAIETDYRAICEVYPPFADCASLDDFKWARMCVCSRNFGIVVDGLRTSAMVPYADMLNHYRPRETKWAYESSKRAFTITSLQTIAGGHQVYDSYGQKCNHRFLLNYGFAIENNREADGFCPNEVAFKFTLDQSSDELHDQKLSLWMRDGAAAKLVRLCASDNEASGLALSCLRVAAANREEFYGLSAAAGQAIGMRGAAPQTVKDVNYPLSLRNERAALMSLAQIVAAKLAAYPTTLAEDLAALAAGPEGVCDAAYTGALPPFSNRRHAVIQVAGEKEVLLHFERLCAVALELAEVDPFDDATFMGKLRDLEAEGCSPHVLRYCGADPRSPLAAARRLERRRLTAQQNAGPNPYARPQHVV